MIRMRTWLLRLQPGLMRILGLRRLGEDLKSSVDADLDALRAELVMRDSSLERRLVELNIMLAAVQVSLSVLRDEEGGRARSATERGDTLDVNIHDLRRTVAELTVVPQDNLLGQNSLEASARLIGDLRVEVSSMRADIAREIEVMTEAIADASRSLTETFAQSYGEIRVEISDMRAESAREMEMFSQEAGISANLFNKSIHQSLGDMRVELSSLRTDVVRKMETLSN